MPSNKNASYRYRVIDNCLKNTGRKWTLDDLVDEISTRLEEDFGKDTGISKRTVQMDISIMRSERPRGFEAPIVCKDGYYSYDDAEYSIENNPLNEQDIKNLEEAIELLKQFKNIPVFTDLQEMVIKLEGIIPEKKHKGRKLIDFETNENLKGLSFIDPIYKAIKNKQVLNLEYLPFTHTENLKMTIHPYLLKEYHNRWFLIGYNDELKKISHLALDRIELFYLSDQKFILAKDYNESVYFENVLGITIPENANPETLELKFTPERAPYIKTKPIHHSQKIIQENENGIVIQLKLVINKELISELLSYGKDLIVLKPESLAKIIKDDLLKAIHSYDF
jgi:predicted DNA-binding transcriptional regulator YafY